MYTITKEQANNFWCDCSLSNQLVIRCYLAISKIFEIEKGFFDDERAKKNAEELSYLINYNHPSENGKYNKAIWIMSMAIAYANYLKDRRNNDRFLNPDSFFLLCTRIAKGVE